MSLDGVWCGGMAAMQDPRFLDHRLVGGGTGMVENPNGGGLWVL
jgi:hypothetical protein